jgi:hypothetical protein
MPPIPEFETRRRTRRVGWRLLSARSTSMRDHPMKLRCVADNGACSISGRSAPAAQRDLRRCMSVRRVRRSPRHGRRHTVPPGHTRSGTSNRGASAAARSTGRSPRNRLDGGFRIPPAASSLRPAELDLVRHVSAAAKESPNVVEIGTHHTQRLCQVPSDRRIGSEALVAASARPVDRSSSCVVRREGLRDHRFRLHPPAMAAKSISSGCPMAQPSCGRSMHNSPARYLWIGNDQRHDQSRHQSAASQRP